MDPARDSDMETAIPPSFAEKKSTDLENPSLKSEEEAANRTRTEDPDPNIVLWDGPDDPQNPMNFPSWRKWLITMTMAALTFTVTLTSSIQSPTTKVVAEKFGVSVEVSILGTSLFILGFAFGPLIWGPASEFYGRKRPLLTGIFIFSIFQIPTAVAQNLYTIMLCRFFGGVAGGAPLAIVGAALGDMFEPITRGVAICCFATATFVGPTCGPIIGGFITQSYLGWRWTSWISLIVSMALWIASLFIIPETYAPILLSRKAEKLRFETKNWALRSKRDEQTRDLKDVARRYLLKPYIMLFTEPILLLLTLYMGFVYALLYLFFESYPISFQEDRGWSPGVGALPFLGILVGAVIGMCIIIYETKTFFARSLARNGKVIPEARLPSMILGAFFLPIGLFMFAWTSNPHIPWPPQVVAGGFIGAGLLMIFLQSLNYIIDCYLMHAASGIAANAVVRSFMGAGFIMFASAMYHNLGVAWATSLLGFLSIALIPVPICFYVFGHKIRSWSRFSPTA